MRRHAAGIFVALVTSASLAGCAEPPRKEMAEAREALEAARAAGAERYAPQEYKDAAETVQRSERFVAERDYRQALSAALDARERAELAGESAAAAKEAARAGAFAALKDLEAAVAESRSFVETTEKHPPRTRPERLHVSEVRRAIVLGNAAVQKARAAMGREDYEAVPKAVEGVSERLRALMAAKPEPAVKAKPRPRR
jgi:hypothetical protein